MELNTGKYGAKVQTWGKANPRELLSRVLDACDWASRYNPGRGRSWDLFAPFVAEVEQAEGLEITPDGYLHAILKYWFTNNIEAALRERGTPADHFAGVPRRKSDKRLQAAADARAEEVITRRIALLELTMPNGKPLRDCTGAECAGFGGWLLSVSDRVADDATVGSALSEDDLRGLYGKTQTP